MSSRRAASEALRSSTSISTSGRLIETQLTAQSGDLVLEHAEGEPAAEILQDLAKRYNPNG
jgi:hypothetical protein